MFCDNVEPTFKSKSNCLANFILICSFLLLLGSCSDHSKEIVHTNVALTWTKTSSFPGIERIKAISFEINNKFYVGLGVQQYNSSSDHNNFFLHDFYSYDPVTDKWQQLAPFPVTGKESLLAFSLGGYGYVALDSSNAICNPICSSQGSKKDIWKYDPSLNSWESVSILENFTNSSSYFDLASSVDSYAYLFNENNLNNGVIRFNPSDNTIHSYGMYNPNILFVSSFVISKEVYFTGGENPPFNKVTYKYNPLNNTWVTKSDFIGTGRRFASGFSLNGLGYISCGETVVETSPGISSTMNIRDTWEYNPTADSWTKVEDYPGDGLVSQSVAYNQNFVLMGGGVGPNGFYTKDYWIGKN